MPQLPGTSKDDTLLSYRGTFIGRYEQESCKDFEQLREIMIRRIDMIAWDLAESLVKRDLYLMSMNDCRTLDTLEFAGIDLILSLNVRSYGKPANLDIGEAEYWKKKFHERLVFDIASYLSSQVGKYKSMIVTAPYFGMGANLTKSPDPDWEPISYAKAYGPKVYELKGLFPTITITAADSDHKPKPKAKWNIINKGKIKV